MLHDGQCLWCSWLGVHLVVFCDNLVAMRDDVVSWRCRVYRLVLHDGVVSCRIVSCLPPCSTWWCISFGLRIDLPLIQTIFAPFLPPRKLASASFPPWRRNQSGWPVPRRRSLPFLRWFGMISFRPPFYSVFFSLLKDRKVWRKSLRLNLSQRLRFGLKISIW